MTLLLLQLQQLLVGRYGLTAEIHIIVYELTFRDIKEIVNLHLSFLFFFSQALRGAATLKARAMKEVLNIAAVLPAERGSTGGPTGAKGNAGHLNHSFSGELSPGEDFLSACSQELLAKGAELLKRTRKGNSNTW